MGSACGASKSAGEVEGSYQPEGEPSKGTRKTYSKGEVFTQRVAVVRHGPREDHANPVKWFTSETGLTNPYDTPLAEEGGKEVAAGVGKNCPKAFDVVVCSPYMRCLQTGCEIAKVHNIPIMFDHNIGEVFDDVYMPKNKLGKKQHRVPKKLRAFLEKEYPEVRVLSAKPDSVDISGKHPVFNEPFDEARVRFMERFEHILLETGKAQLNPIIVTHADAVVVIFETLTGREAEHVDYCGWFICEKPQTHGTFEVWTDKWTWEVGGHMKLEPGEPLVTSFVPVKTSVGAYRAKMKPYPKLPISATLVHKHSDDEKQKAMDGFWGGGTATEKTTSNLVEDNNASGGIEGENMTMGGALKVMMAVRKFKKPLGARGGFTPAPPEGFEMKVGDDEEEEEHN